MRTTKHLNIFIPLAFAVLATLTAKAQDIVLASVANQGSSSLTLSSANPLDFTAAGGTKAIGIKTNLKVKPRSESTWLSAETSGDSVKVKAEAYGGKQPREGIVVLPALDGNTQTIKVRQLGSEPAFFVNKQEVDINGKAPNIILGIVSNAELSFTSSDWIESGNVVWQNGDVQYTVKTTALKTPGNREGEINIQLKGDETSRRTVSVKHVFEGFTSFIVMSDIHFGSGDAKTRVTQSLSNLYAENSGVDALIVNGDLTQNGNASQYSEMLNVMNDENIVPSEVKRVFVMGNHEWYTSEDAMKNYEATGTPHKGYFSIKGYPFVYIGLSGSGNEDYSDESIAFLENSLKDATVRYAGKPIFVFTHIPAYGTTHGSSEEDGGWGSRKIYNTLRNFPQVIHFCGHTHYSVRDARALWQGDFTSIDDGTNDYTEIQPGIDYEGIHPYRVNDVQEGLIVSVEDENNVNVRRMDSRRNEEVLPQWNFSAPYDKTNMPYATVTDKDAPYFDDAEVKAEEMQKGARNIVFNQAQDDDNVVLYYNVRIFDENGDSVASQRICSRFYLGSEMPTQLNVTFTNLPLEKELHASVTAVDPYGNESEPVESGTFSFSEYQPAEGTTLPKADLLDLKISDDGEVSDVSEMGNTVTMSGFAPVLAYDKEYGLNSLLFENRTDQFYYVDYAGNDEIKGAFASAFTFETFFDCNTVGNDMCMMSSQNSGGAGLEIEPSNFLVFYCHVGGSYRTVNSGIKIKPGDRYHAVATYSKNDGKIKLYVNGYPAGSTDVSGEFGFPDEGAQWIAIGGDASSNKTSAQFPFDGQVMAARMYSKAVSRDEVYLMYRTFADRYHSVSEDTTTAEVAPVADLFDVEFGENGAVTDKSPQQIAITTGKTVPQTYYNETYNRWTAKFTGKDNQEYYGVPYADNMAIMSAMESDFTLEVFTMLNDATADQCVVSSQQQGGFGIEPAGTIDVWGRYGNEYSHLYSNVNVEAGKFYHIVAVADAGETEMRVYINGQPAGKRSVTGMFSFPQGNAKYFCIGGDASYDGDHAEFLLNGEIVLTRMYSKALKLSDAKKLYKDILEYKGGQQAETQP